MKWALFDQRRMVRHGVWTEGNEQQCAEWVAQCAAVIVCASGQVDYQAWGLDDPKVCRLTAQSPLPIAIDYDTPHTLGPDRIAAACGAWRLACAGQQRRGTVVIDAGTCITIDYLDAAGVYHGGAILPGIEMKFHALHTFTAKLPLLENIDAEKRCVTGKTTSDAIIAGVLTATRFEVEGFVRHYRQQHGAVSVVLTGGDAERLLCGMQLSDCRCEPALVHIGLEEVLAFRQKEMKCQE